VDVGCNFVKVSASEMMDFFNELQNSGSVEEVSLSWIKYAADALNTRLVQATSPTDPAQFPNDLDFPRLPPQLAVAIRSIITETAKSRSDLVDVLGVSYSSLLASIPTLAQRGKIIIVVG
jgi:hypothetical protein